MKTASRAMSHAARHRDGVLVLWHVLERFSACRSHDTNLDGTAPQVWSVWANRPTRSVSLCDEPLWLSDEGSADATFHGTGTSLKLPVSLDTNEQHIFLMIFCQDHNIQQTCDLGSRHITCNWATGLLKIRQSALNSFKHQHRAVNDLIPTFWPVPRIYVMVRMETLWPVRIRVYF